MSNFIKSIVIARKREIARTKETKLRKHLNADALIKTMRTGFAGIRDHRFGTVTHTLADSLMAGFALFSLKDLSLLAFDERRLRGPYNLMTIYGMGSIPCDTSIREILDGVAPNDLRPLFKDAFRQLQRGKVPEKFVFMEGCYLLNLDGTGYFSSDSIHSDGCLEKVNKKTGKVTYYLQTVGAAVVHHDLKEVIVLPSETIRKQDKPHLTHCFRIVYDAPLNKSYQDKRVTFVEYWGENSKTGKTQHVTWITDLSITEDNVFHFIRGARARWKIDNETFNTLKNPGYHFEHNFGLGKKHLSEVFVLLMMLAFLIDHIQQLCCPLFQAAWKSWKTKRSLWEKMRSKFHEFHIETMEDLYRFLLEYNPVPLR